jgi:hypothetical protein
LGSRRPKPLQLLSTTVPAAGRPARVLVVQRRHGGDEMHMVPVKAPPLSVRTAQACWPSARIAGSTCCTATACPSVSGAPFSLTLVLVLLLRNPSGRRSHRATVAVSGRCARRTGGPCAARERRRGRPLATAPRTRARSLSQPQGRQLVRWVVLWRHALLQPLNGYICGQVRRPAPPSTPPSSLRRAPLPAAASESFCFVLHLRHLSAVSAPSSSSEAPPDRAPCDRLRHPRSQPRHKDTWRSP